MRIQHEYGPQSSGASHSHCAWGLRAGGLSTSQVLGFYSLHRTVRVHRAETQGFTTVQTSLKPEEASEQHTPILLSP